MNKQIYTRSGSHFCLHKCKKFSNLEEGGIFYSNKASDMPDLQVELKCYAIELKSQTKLKEISKNSILNNKIYLKNEKQLEERTRTLPIESLSCDSFYSCQSSTSMQEIKPKENSETNEKSKRVTYLASRKNKTTSNEELLNQLTMMNALFLSKSVKECLKKEECNNTKRENGVLNTQIGTNEKLLYSPDVSNRFYSGAFTCQINKNEEFKYANEVHNENETTKLIMKNPNFTFNMPEADPLNLQQPLKGKSNIKKPETNLKREPGNKIDFPKNRKNSNINTKMDEDSIFNNKNDVTKSKFVFRKRKETNLKSHMYKKSEIKLQEMNSINISSICNENNITVDTNNYQCKIEQSKQSINQGYEIEFESSTYLKSKLILVSPEKFENMLKSNDICCGDGQFINRETVKSFHNLNNLFIENVNESHVKKLINQSLEKLYNESEQVSELYVSLSCKRKDLNFMLFSSDLENILKEKNSTTKLRGKNMNSLKFDANKNKINLSTLETHQDDTEIITVKDPPNLIRPGSGIDCCNPGYVTINQPDNCIKRKLSERKCSLPVIKEESTESLTLVLSEDSLTDSYCLVDNYGNTIHLFDAHGLPLTDNCGRPLRFADGELLMKCDRNGVPVVDLENCTIYDMFGKNPHEPEFNPAVAPKTTVCNKLSTHDGKPLLLFDVEGRPLTSISGTMLVDSLGRGLVRLSSTATLDHIE